LNISSIRKLGPAVRTRVLQLCGLLARPSLSDEDVASLRALVEADAWKPVPRLSSFNLLEPLFLHHLARLEIDADRVFRKEAEGPAHPPAAEQLALAYYQRLRVQGEAFDALREGGVTRLMLIKGAALAPLYPSPALRQMCDLDMVVDGREMESAAAALRRVGWQPRQHIAGEVWEHALSGLLLDLQEPGTRLAREIFESAIRHPVYTDKAIVCMPRPGHHLVLLAIHSAGHGGDRVWRDVCDARVLLGMGGPRVVVSDALALAREGGGMPQTIALLRFMGESAQEDELLPSLPPMAAREEVSCRHHLALYQELAVDVISPVALNMVRVSVRPLREHIEVAIRRLLAKTGRGTGTADADSPRWAESDPLLGTMPPAGTFARQWTKARVLLHLWRSHQLNRYRKLVRLQDEVSHRASIFHARHTALAAKD
jgi:hypothetical protein